MAAEKEITPLPFIDDVALYQQGLWYLEEGERQDIAKAAEHFYYSAKLMTRNEHGSLAAVKALESLVKEGKVTSVLLINALGEFYHHGLGGDRDDEYHKAFTYYSRIADHPVAKFNLGILYHYGHWVKVDKVKAAGYYFDAMLKGRCSDAEKSDIVNRVPKELAILASDDPFFTYSPLRIAHHIKHGRAIIELSKENPDEALELALLYKHKHYIWKLVVKKQLSEVWEKAFLLGEKHYDVLEWLISLYPNVGLLQAAKKGRVDLMQIALACPTVNVDLVISDAVLKENNDVVQCLIEEGTKVRVLADETLSLVRIVAQLDNAVVIKLLAAEGYNDFTAEDVINNRLLHTAVRHGHLEAVKLLMNDETIIVFNHRGLLPLHCAAENNQCDIMTLLLTRLDLINLTTTYGRTALQIATAHNHREAVILLLQHGAEVNAQNDDGETSLHTALAKNHDALATLLINHDADLTMVDTKGKAAIGYAKTDAGAASIFKAIVTVNTSFIQNLDKEIARLTKKGDELSGKKVDAFNKLRTLIITEKLMRPLGAYITQWMLEEDGQSLKTIAQSSNVFISRNIQSLECVKHALIALNPEYREYAPEDTRPLTLMNNILKGNTVSFRTSSDSTAMIASSSSSNAVASSSSASSEARTPLEQAVLDNDSGTVIALLAGDSINQGQVSKALQLAYQAGNVALARLLINHDANPQVTGSMNDHSYNQKCLTAGEIEKELKDVNVAFLNSLDVECERLARDPSKRAGNKSLVLDDLYELIINDHNKYIHKPLGAYLCEWMQENDGKNLRTIAQSRGIGSLSRVTSLNLIKDAINKYCADYRVYANPALRPLSIFNRILAEIKQGKRSITNASSADQHATMQALDTDALSPEELGTMFAAAYDEKPAPAAASSSSSSSSSCSSSSSPAFWASKVPTWAEIKTRGMKNYDEKGNELVVYDYDGMRYTISANDSDTSAPMTIDYLPQPNK